MTSYVCFLGFFAEGKELTLFNLTKIDIYFFPQLHLMPWDPPLAFNSTHCVFVLIPRVVLDFAPLLSAFPIDTVPMNLIGWHVGKESEGGAEWPCRPLTKWHAVYHV